MSQRVAIDVNVHIPMPVFLVGVMSQGKPTFMTAGWVARANLRPPMLAVGMFDQHYTAGAIKEAGAFSLCMPSNDLRVETDYCGLVSAKRTDKSQVFQTTPGPETGAPLIDGCSLVIECKLYDPVALPSHTLFVGEIVSAFCNDDCLTDGSPDYAKIDPLLLTMPDNTYWRLGEKMGKAWSDGKALKQK